MNILIIGTGAVGSLCASQLAKTGAKVSMVARGDYEKIGRDGIEIDSAEFGQAHFMPAAVYRSASEVKDKPDYILLCVKMVEGVDLPALVGDALGPDTTIVLIANGIDVERPLAEAFPSHEVIGGLTYIYATRIAPGKIRHQGHKKLVLGVYRQGVSEKTKTLAALFARAGFASQASDDIVTMRWTKCVWNAGFNPVSVLSGGLTVKAILEIAESFIRAVMDDVCRTAAASGHPLPADIVDKNIELSWKMEPYKTSMLVDFEAGKPMEVEAILGNAVRAARGAGVAAPHLESLYALMKMREMAVSPEVK